MFGGKHRARIAELEAEVARLERLPETVAAVDTQRMSAEVETLRARVAESAREVETLRARVAELEVDRDDHARRLREFLRNHPEIDPDDPRPDSRVKVMCWARYAWTSRMISVDPIPGQPRVAWDDVPLLEKRARQIEAWERRQLAREIAELIYRPGGPGARAARQNFEEDSVRPLDS